MLLFLTLVCLYDFTSNCTFFSISVIVNLLFIILFDTIVMIHLLPTKELLHISLVWTWIQIFARVSVV